MSCNPAYDDGTESGCGDTYSALNGVESCGLGQSYGGIGMSNYQQGLNSSNANSFCIQSQDYAPVQRMYDITAIPEIAKLQYYEPTTYLSKNGENYVNDIIINVQGETALPSRQIASPQAIRFMQQAENGASKYVLNIDRNQGAFKKQNAISKGQLQDQLQSAYNQGMNRGKKEAFSVLASVNRQI
jgi:hypothetical protein